MSRHTSGDRVVHRREPTQAGVVHDVSANGRFLLVKWDGGEAEIYEDVDLQPAPATSGAAIPEPPPIPTDGPSMHDLVIKDLDERKKFGLEKYDTILQAHNGRDPLMDAYQEVLDQAVYLRQAIIEREHDRAERSRLQAQVAELTEQLGDAWGDGTGGRR